MDVELRLVNSFQSKEYEIEIAICYMTAQSTHGLLMTGGMVSLKFSDEQSREAPKERKKKIRRGL